MSDYYKAEDKLQSMFESAEEFFDTQDDAWHRQTVLHASVLQAESLAQIAKQLEANNNTGHLILQGGAHEERLDKHALEIGQLQQQVAELERFRGLAVKLFENHAKRADLQSDSIDGLLTKTLQTPITPNPVSPEQYDALVVWIGDFANACGYGGSLNLSDQVDEILAILGKQGTAP